MADFTLDATLTTANPYTPAGMTVQVGTFRSASGTGARASANGVIAQMVHATAYGALIRADVTLSSSLSAGDDIAACIVARSGANSAKGYCAYLTGTTIILAKLDGAGNFTDISGSIVSYTQTAGDVLTCLYNTANGSLQSIISGTTKFTATDTTYQAETSLAAGVLVSAANVNGSFFTTFAGTGVAAGLLLTQLERGTRGSNRGSMRGMT